MYVTFTQACGGDSDEVAILAHVFYGAVAGIPHRGTQAADELMNNTAYRTFEWHSTFDPFGHEFEIIRNFLLKIH